jgi:choline dehydrogenase-like flavoprotein
VRTHLREVVAERYCRFGPRFKDTIANSDNVDVYLHANVTRINLEPSRKRVASVRIATLSGKRRVVHARQYVLATGGIENPRLLLLSSIGEDTGSGPSQVGRYYANHPETMGGSLVLVNPQPWMIRSFRPVHHRGGMTLPLLRLARAVQETQELLNCWMQPFQIVQFRRRGQKKPPREDARQVGELAGLVGSGTSRKAEPVAMSIHTISEPSPNPDSRVRLGDELDALGQRRAVLDWRVADRDSDSLQRTLKIFASEVGASDIGRFRIDFPAAGFSAVDPRGSHHHMGTTRMHADPNQGVVTPDCRVHGVSNLFVAGSSVFPTYGTANPTFTILALAFRLADHVLEVTG